MRYLALIDYIVILYLYSVSVFCIFKKQSLDNGPRNLVNEQLIDITQCKGHTEVGWSACSFGSSQVDD